MAISENRGNPSLFLLGANKRDKERKTRGETRELQNILISWSSWLNLERAVIRHACQTIMDSGGQPNDVLRMLNFRPDVHFVVMNHKSETAARAFTNIEQMKVKDKFLDAVIASGGSTAILIARMSGGDAIVLTNQPVTQHPCVQYAMFPSANLIAPGIVVMRASVAPMMLNNNQLA